MRIVTGGTHTIEGVGFVDEVTAAYDPRRSGWAIAVRREYDRVSERLDLKAVAPWVAWRKALQGCE